MENEFHDWLRTKLANPQLIVPLGDDAAVVDWSTMGNCVVTSDLLADGVHFKLPEASPERIGRKCLAVNLSDMAAMAATPIAAVVSLLLPSSYSENLARKLLEGMVPLAEEFQTAIVGGDTNVWEGNLAINVTLLGVVSDFPPLRRDSAKVGDLVMVTGALGGSIAGHHFDFTPRIREAKLLQSRYSLTAGMDISDGLSLDAARLARCSNCGIELQLDQIPISNASMALAGHESDALKGALGDGEDFELLFTAAPVEASNIVREQPLDIPVTIVGECIAELGLYQRTVTGREKLEISGYEHR